MKKVLAFAGSTSSTSINHQLVVYAASQLLDIKIDVIEMRNHTAALYSVDEEKNGFPESMLSLSNTLKKYDGFIVSLAEHNGSYASAYKNTIDWLSRVDKTIFNNKPMLLMSASPGGRGGASVIQAAQSYYPRLGANIIEIFSFPSFYNNFSDGKITNLELDKLLKEKVTNFISKLEL